MANSEEMTPLSADEDLEAAQRAREERNAELARLREMNAPEKGLFYIGGNTKSCIALYLACLFGVGLYVGISLLLAWGIPSARAG